MRNRLERVTRPPARGYSNGGICDPCRARVVSRAVGRRSVGGPVMRTRWCVAIVLGGLLVVVMAPSTGLTQRPGGFGGDRAPGGFGGGGAPGGFGGFGGGGSGGFGRMDPTARFEEMAKGRGYFEISEITDPQRRERYAQFAQQNGINDGRITK